MNMQRDTAASELNQFTALLGTVIVRWVCLILLVLRAKNEKGAGFRQWDSFFLQLQVRHWSGPRADGNFWLYLLVITYDDKENRPKVTLSTSYSRHQLAELFAARCIWLT